MKVVPKGRFGAPARITRALVVFSLCVGTSASPGEQSIAPPPTVASASVPFYPPLPRSARIEGSVRLRVSTDGKRVSRIEVEGGPPMLVPASEDNVRTWQFNDHSPTTFEVTFVFKMLPESDCEMDNGTVILRLPTEVQIIAKGIRTCDPEEVPH
jgi:outer membrane biosynthesis protein TonB